MLITNEILEQGKSRHGGWSLAQLRIFGIKRFYKGWKRNLLGSDFGSSFIDRFLDLKDAHLGLNKPFIEPTVVSVLTEDVDFCVTEKGIFQYVVMNYKDAESWCWLRHNEPHKNIEAMVLAWAEVIEKQRIRDGI